MKKLAIMFVLSSFSLSCNDGNDNVSLLPEKELNDYFDGNKSGWEAGFADYSIHQTVDWKLEEGIANLPAPLDTQKKGFRISGMNHSDDLFMYLKKKITGLKPNQAYSASFIIDFASNAPSGHHGVGGAPDNVFVGIGAGPVEPKATVGPEEIYRMNIDKIDQTKDGKDMKIIGNIGTGTDKEGYKLLQRVGDFIGKTDDTGNLWLIIGTDSGYESTTTLYYTSVNLKLKEANSIQ